VVITSKNPTRFTHYLLKIVARPRIRHYDLTKLHISPTKWASSALIQIESFHSLWGFHWSCLLD